MHGPSLRGTDGAVTAGGTTPQHPPRMEGAAPHSPPQGVPQRTRHPRVVAEVKASWLWRAGGPLPGPPRVVAEVRALGVLWQGTQSPDAPRAVAEVKGRLPWSAGQMAESGIMPGLPTGTEAAR